MPPDNIFAFTAPGADAPEFVSINKGSGGGIELIVRSPKGLGGATAQISLNLDQVRSLIGALVTHDVTETQIKHMAEQFLRWKLPTNFNPDGGISFEPVGNPGTPHEYRRAPTGTNLFGYTEAEAMVRHMLDGFSSV